MFFFIFLFSFFPPHTENLPWLRTEELGSGAAAGPLAGARVHPRVGRAAV